jgi:hypothetical protein
MGTTHTDSLLPLLLGDQVALHAWRDVVQRAAADRSERITHLEAWMATRQANRMKGTIRFWCAWSRAIAWERLDMVIPPQQQQQSEQQQEDGGFAEWLMRHELLQAQSVAAGKHWCSRQARSSFGANVSPEGTAPGMP